MLAVSVVLVAFSIQELAGGDQHDKTLHIPAAVVVGVSFRMSPSPPRCRLSFDVRLRVETFLLTVSAILSAVVKLALFLYCWPLRSKNSQVHVLWEEQ